MFTSRRDVLMQLAATGGWAVALGASQALGMSLTDIPKVEKPDLPPGSGAGKRVLVLGGGIAGLVSAYELGKAGYEVKILEARPRTGGRTWTLRSGDTVDFTDGQSQTVGFDKDIWMNAGPARLPGWHRTILGYCKELGVELTVLVNANRSALYAPSDPSVAPLRLRQVNNDARGLVAELLAKSINKGALDAEVTEADRNRLKAFLGAWSDIAPDGTFKGTDRSGFKTWPGAGNEHPVHVDPLKLQTILNPESWESLLFEELIDFQPNMLQPVGGMDRIPAAFTKRLKGKITLGAEVLSVENKGAGVEVVWRNRKTGKETVEQADFAIVTLPLKLLAKVKTNLPAAMTAAIAKARYEDSVKVGWQSRRFWEGDGPQGAIYGGISYTAHEVNHIWYPSHGFHREKGFLLGCYNFGPDAGRYGAKALADQYASSRAAVERLHPGQGHELEKPVSVVWTKIPFNEGPWIDWEHGGTDYRTLNEPSGQIYLAGEHLSFLTSWQEGAALSALRVVGMIGKRVKG